MKKLLPPTTNAAYTGGRAPILFLALLVLVTLIPGLLHTLLPDGGAGVIAGLDLSSNGDTIVRIFAWAGITQIVWGLMLLAIVVRYRSMIPLALLLLLLERCMHAINMWWPRDDGVIHHPPEAYGTLLMVPLIALFLALSLRRSNSA